MTRIQRQIFARSAIVGALITLTAIAADISGFLSPTENWLYDLRARHFQFAGTKPTDKLVHVDIDDKALDVTGVGTWPWPRAKLAGILDEMRLAGVKAVALDILYSEPWNATAPATRPSQSEPVAQIDDDATLAAAIAKLGCVVVPAAATFEPPNTSPAYRAMVDDLRKQPELDEGKLTGQLQSQLPGTSDIQRKVFDGYIDARKDAMYQRITQEMAAHRLSREELRSIVLQSQQAELSSPVARVFNQQFDRWDAAEGLDRLGTPIAAGTVPLVHVSMKTPPLPIYVHAAAATGFVDYKPGRDGVLRSVPLLAEHEGHMIPQMGLSLAMLTLGIKPGDLHIGPSSVVLPRGASAPIVIPVHTDFFPLQGRTIGTVFDIPWFGGSSWLEMYDWPAHARPAQHMGINAVWGAHDTQSKITKNNSEAQDALHGLKDSWGIDYKDTPRAIEDPAAFEAAIDSALREIADFEQAAKQKPRLELAREEQVLLASVGAIRHVREENPRLAAQLRDQRAILTSQLAGKSVLIGRIATGYIDVVPTSIHPSSPGVITHGVIFNAIMTGAYWTRPPGWVTPAVTLILGLGAALLATWLSPLLGLLITLLLAGGYVLFNGYVLFDRGDLLVGMAGPLTALGTVWAGCTLNRIIMEMGERKRILSRFGSYVDPSLVNYVLENPDQVRFEGDMRELTVVFTDLAGFTTLSEKLGEATVPLLNEYFGRMVPIIRKRDGYMNKFLGDGIMFFFGAPIPKSNHAHLAVESVLEMQLAMEDFNRELTRRGMPPLSMRAGISTGMMVVGDAGASDRTDYTVLGDIVNLGARLEGANKATGTSILVNDRAAELIRDQYLLRPIGALQVKGKAVWVMTYEPIARLSEAHDRQKRLVELTGAVVDAFIPGDFEQCLVAADKLEAEFGPSPLAAIYREQCRHNIEKPPEAFDGRIELTEK